MVRDSVATAPGARRAVDGTAVPFRGATVAWALAAHADLAEIATGYGSFITINELAERVQEASGIHTEAPTRAWMDAILRKVARRCHRAGEPPLTALCVRQNHAVGDSYRYVLELAALPVPEDLELHAAYARWQCHQHFGAGMPADGGVPPLTPKVAARRRMTAVSAGPQSPVEPDRMEQVRTATAQAVPDRIEQPEPEPPSTRTRVCDECFIQLPASGTCHYCG